MRTLIDERKYPSTRRGSTAKYLCKKWSDGDYSCDCPGWRFKQPDKPRGCSHCIWFAQDYWLVTIAEASRITLADVKFDVITTYGRFLYLLRFRAGETFRPAAPKPVPAVTASEISMTTRDGRGRWSQKAGTWVDENGDPVKKPRDRDSAREQFSVGEQSGRLPRMPMLPKKAVIFTPKSGRARNAFDEEV